MASLLLALSIFHIFFSIDDFEQVNVAWVEQKLLLLNLNRLNLLSVKARY